MQETRVQSLGQEDPLEKKKWQPTPVFLPWEPHEQCQNFRMLLFLILVILIRVWWYHITAFFFSLASWLTVFTFHVLVCISSPVNCLSVSFALFLIVFWVWRVLILDTCPLSDEWSANTFSWFIPYICICFTWTTVLNFGEVRFVNFSLVWIMFSIVKNIKLFIRR